MMEDMKGFKRFKEELNFAMLIAGQCGVPACAEGDPGIGKTETLRALALASSRNFFSYELSRTQPEDLQGFPVVDEYTYGEEVFKYMRFVPDERLLKAEMELSLLLIDEVTNVIAPKQAPALNLISNGLKNCWMFMACNPLESAADGQPLTCPFINRIWKGPWEVDEEAQDWGMQHRLQFPDPEIPLVPQDYMEFQPRWGCLITDYWAYNPQHRNACPKDKKEKGEPWPSSRTWAYLSRCLAGVESVQASVMVRDKVVKGLVGEKVGTNFITYLNNLALPQPEDVLKEGETFQLHDRYDINIAILEAVVNYLRRLPTEEHFNQAIAVYEGIQRQNREMATIFMGGLRRHMPAFAAKRDKELLVK